MAQSNLVEAASEWRHLVPRKSAAKRNKLLVPQIKMGAAELPAKDVAYIRALVRLISFGQNVQWQFVEQAPYDVLVVDAEVTPEHVALISGKSCLLLRVRRERRSALSRIGSNDSIDYPIRALQLKAWLRANQVALLSSPTTRGYRLRRWPSTALLQGDALKIHMATLLSKSTLTPRAGQCAGSTQPVGQHSPSIERNLGMREHKLLTARRKLSEAEKNLVF